MLAAALAYRENGGHAAKQRSSNHSRHSFSFNRDSLIGPKGISGNMYIRLPVAELHHFPDLVSLVVIRGIPEI